MLVLIRKPPATLKVGSRVGGFMWLVSFSLNQWVHSSMGKPKGWELAEVDGIAPEDKEFIL